MLTYTPGGLLSLHFYSGLQGGLRKIRMKHPYYTFLLLYAMKLEVPRAHWDTHKLNSIENSIWDQRFPRAISTGIIMYKKHPVRFSQNNRDFKGPHPNNDCEKSFLGKPQGHVFLKGSTPECFTWMFLDCFNMNTGENSSSFLFSSSLLITSHWISGSCGVPTDNKEGRNILNLQAAFGSSALVKL